MYIAAIACNVGGNHWKLPAQWMYYHLLDADWASNALSWQWVAGSNSHKKYYANQENINTYCGTAQHGTFLDVAYSNFESLGFPAQLAETELLNLITELPPKNKVRINEVLPTCIYNAYNLDPLWLKNLDANRVLLLEPSHFKAYPMSKKSIDFILALSENISNIQVFVGEFSEFANNVQEETLHYKEHPLNNHYKGIMTARDWMTQVEGYYPSFFKFWKLSKKELQLLFNNHIK